MAPSFSAALMSSTPSAICLPSHKLRSCLSRGIASITFRVTVGTRDKFIDSNPLPIDCEKTLNDFLLDMHFQLQVFRGMEMRSLEPLKTWMIGVPADEASDERIYRSTFDLRDVRPDDRLVLLVSDGSGATRGMAGTPLLQIT